MELRSRLENYGEGTRKNVKGRPSRDRLNRRTSDRRLDRQAISDEFAAVENLQELAAGKATIFAVGPALG